MSGILDVLIIKKSRKVGKYVRDTNYLLLVSYTIFIGTALFATMVIMDTVCTDNQPLWYSIFMTTVYLIFGIFIMLVVRNIITSIYFCENENKVNELINIHKIQDQEKKRLWKRYYVLNKDKGKLLIKSYIPLILSILLIIATLLILIFYYEHIT